MALPKPVILDISEHQSPAAINYDKLAKEVGGVIVRVQYGSLYVDKHYKTHITEFKKRGVPVAVYAWVRGISYKDMEVEAADFYNRAKSYDPDFWWLDVEEQSMTDMRGGCEKFRTKLKALGAKKVGAYIANHLFKKFNLDVNKFDGVWVPTYGKNNGRYEGSNPTATNRYDIHQYTSAGHLNGYNGNLDLNRLVDAKQLSYFFGSVAPVAKGPNKAKYWDKPGWYEVLVDNSFYTNPSFSVDTQSRVRLGKGSRFYFDEVTTNPSKTAYRGVTLAIGRPGKRYFTLNKEYVKKV